MQLQTQPAQHQVEGAILVCQDQRHHYKPTHRHRQLLHHRDLVHFDLGHWLVYSWLNSIIDTLQHTVTIIINESNRYAIARQYTWPQRNRKRRIIKRPLDLAIAFVIEVIRYQCQQSNLVSWQLQHCIMVLEWLVIVNCPCIGAVVVVDVATQNISVVNHRVEDRVGVTALCDISDLVGVGVVGMVGVVIGDLESRTLTQLAKVFNANRKGPSIQLETKLTDWRVID